jgi:SSS family solute:Na+ symporter
MTLSSIDILTFLSFIALVVGVSLYASRREKTSADYFLAGRNLPWWLIGISLIASNISTEHFIGMAGEGYDLGLAIACFEWVAAIALVFVALVLLPRFLRSGIYTLPEFLEYRYSLGARSIMAFYLMVIYVIVGMAGVLYSGSLALKTTPAAIPSPAG